MPSYPLIDAYVMDLTHRLPVDTVDELADGLVEAWQRHCANGLAPEDAERAAIAEFGPAGWVADDFVAQAPGRRTARLLLATGPVMGVCWGASLVTAKVWTWPIPATAAVAYVAALLAVVVLLLAAGTSRHSYRRARLGGWGAVMLAALDAAMLVAVAMLTPALVWPMAVAVPASLFRIGFAVRSRPRRVAA
jgi:hypothetical protein